MSLLDTAINWFQEARDATSETVTEWSQEWQNSVNNFTEKARTFVSTFNGLKNRAQLASNDPELKRAYDSLMSKGAWIYNSIASIASKIDFLNNSNTVGAMGILPLVPIAVITGAIAVMTAWLSDAYIMTQKLDTLERMVEQGADPVTMSESLNEGESLVSIKGSGFQSLLLLGVIGFGIYKLIPLIQEANRGR